MKNTILLFALLLISFGAFAQTKPSFGIKAGLSSASMKGEAVNSLQNLIDYANGHISTQNRTGFFAGGNVSIPLGEIFSVEPGIYYAQKGYEMRGELNLKGMEFLNPNAKAILTSHYIDLPVLLKANLSGFQVFAGPQLSWLAKADLHTTAGLLGFNLLNKTMDATNQFNRWDAGLVGGIGYQFGNGMNITASYEHGLSKADANKNWDAYNRSFKVGIGFKF